MASITEPEILSKSVKELADVRPKLPVRFEYMHRSLRHYGLVSETSNGHRLRLIIEVTTVPYSSENTNARETLLQLLHSQLQIEHGKFTLNNKQKLVYQIEKQIDGAITGATIVAAATELTLRARPYIISALEFATLPRPEVMH